jgi:hypothetical protein
MPLSNYNVYARASTAFILPILVLFAFASYCFLCCFFAFNTIIFCAYYDSNFLIYLLLYIEDYIEIGVITGT